MQANYKQRLRLNFSKGGPARYIGHLDLAKTLERALNRARVPLAYTQGFNPRPRMAFADALPLGFTSECEFVDLWLKEECNPQDVIDDLAEKMPSGLETNSIGEVNLASPALQALTISAEYDVFLGNTDTVVFIQDRIQSLLDSPTLPRARRNKSYDLRPLIINLTSSIYENGQIVLVANMVSEPGRTGRPDEVLKALDFDPLSARIHKTKLLLRNSS